RRSMVGESLCPQSAARPGRRQRQRQPRSAETSPAPSDVSATAQLGPVEPDCRRNELSRPTLEEKLPYPGLSATGGTIAGTLAAMSCAIMARRWRQSVIDV